MLDNPHNPPLKNYIVVNVGTNQIVQNIDTDKFYLTIDHYAALAEVPPIEVHNKAIDHYGKGEVLYLGLAGVNHVSGQALIPIELVYSWLLEDSPTIANMLASHLFEAAIIGDFLEGLIRE